MPAIFQPPVKAHGMEVAAHSLRTIRSDECTFKQIMRSWFLKFSKWTAVHAGRPATFTIAVAVVLAWAISGPVFGFSDTWQLVINTGTTIITFLMVFLIQNTQNRDGEAVQGKLDELICATRDARNELLDLEELDEDQLEKIRAHYLHLAEIARKEMHKDARE